MTKYKTYLYSFFIFGIIPCQSIPFAMEEQVGDIEMDTFVENSNKDSLEKSIDLEDSNRMYELARSYKKGKTLKKDLNLAFIFYEKAAKLGHADAMFKVAGAYENGQGIKEDLHQAFQWYEKAAQQRHQEAMFKVAWAYANGKGTLKDFYEASRWYEKLANLGFPTSMNNLAHLYEHGYGVEQDIYKALEWYEKAANLGNSEATFHLTHSYNYGKSDEERVAYSKAIFTVALRYKNQDRYQAFKLYKKAATLGLAKAMFNTANAYRNGKGVQRGLYQAFEWYAKAAKLGHLKSMYRLGDAYYYGAGVEANIQKAIFWFEKSLFIDNKTVQEKQQMPHKIEESKGFHDLERIFQLGHFCNEKKKKFERAFAFYEKAAKRGHLDAMFKVAGAYADGKGIKQVLYQAFQWYEKAAKRGHVDAMYHIAQAYTNGKVIQKDLCQAFEWYGKAAQRGHTEAMYYIGCSYKNGLGIEKDHYLAFKWHKKAADLGLPKSMNNLACLYKDGYGVEKNHEKMILWFEKALFLGTIEARDNLSIFYFNTNKTDKFLEINLQSGELFNGFWPSPSLKDVFEQNDGIFNEQTHRFLCNRYKEIDQNLKVFTKIENNKRYDCIDGKENIMRERTENIFPTMFEIAKQRSVMWKIFGLLDDSDLSHFARMSKDASSFCQIELERRHLLFLHVEKYFSYFDKAKITLSFSMQDIRRLFYKEKIRLLS